MKENRYNILDFVVVITFAITIWNTTTLGSVSDRMDGRIDNLNGKIYEMQHEKRLNKNKQDSFNSVFKYNYNKYGEGHLFEWNDKVYTTDKHKE